MTAPKGPIHKIGFCTFSCHDQGRREAGSASMAFIEEKVQHERETGGIGSAFDTTEVNWL